MREGPRRELSDPLLPPPHDDQGNIAPMNAHTVADGYSRTDQRVPIATSTTPVSPPLDYDYNDGVAPADDAEEFDGNENYGSTSNKNDDYDYDYENEYDDDGIGTGVDNHLPHPSRPRLLQTHEGEHRHDFGDDRATSSSSSASSSSSKLRVTRSTMIYAACASLNSCNLGYDIGVNTGAGPLLQISMGLTDLQLGIFMGSMNLFAMIGALSSHYVSDKFGRRWSFRIAALGFVFGTIIQSLAKGYGGLMLGRSFVGYGVGFGLAVDPVYIGEISQAAHRGRLVTWSEIATNVGILLGFVSGLAFADVDGDRAWRWMFALGAILPCFVVYFSTFVMPESPRWLVSRNRDEEARGVLKLVYPGGYDVDVIVRDIKEGIEKEAMAEHAIGWDVILFPTPAFKRMLLVGVGTAIAQQAVGIDAIQYFLVYILDESGVKSRKAQMVILIVLGIIKLTFIVLAGHLFDKRGRRPLFFVSLIGMSVSLLLVSMGFVGKADGAGFAVFGLALYLAFFSLGMGPGAWLIPSEVFSTLIRAKAMSVATFMNRVTATIMSTTFLSVANAMSWAGFFVMMSIVCLIILGWMFVYLPETKGRPLEDMAQYFAEITGDRSIFEAEEFLHRGDDPSLPSEGTTPAVAESATRTPLKPVAFEKPPPEDAHIIGTMA